MSEAIIEKIKKLMALGERGGTEAEAELAMAKVHELLAKHNLSMDAITDSHEPDDDYDRQEFDVEKGGPWQAFIWQGVARLYFCSYYYNRSRKVHGVIGKKSNIAVVNYLGAYLIRTAKKLSLEAYNETCPEHGRGKYRRSFHKGFADRVSQRCAEQLRKAKQNEMRDERGQALILHPLYDKSQREIEAFIKSIGLGLKSGGSGQRGASDYSAYGRGQTAGNDVSLTANGLHARAAVKQLA